MSASQPRATCPNCQARIRVNRPELIGTLVKCPGCSQPFRVALSEAAKPQAEIAAASDASSEDSYQLSASKPSSSFNETPSDETDEDIDDFEYADDDAVDSEDVSEEVDEFDDEPVTRKRRRGKSDTSVNSLPIEPIGSRSGGIVAAIAAGCVVVTYLTSIAWPVSHPEITRYGSLPTDEAPSTYDGPNGETGNFLFDLIARSVFERPEPELLRTLDEVIEKKSTLPPEVLHSLALRAMPDDRAEVLLRAVVFADRDRLPGERDFFLKAVTHSDERVVQAAVQALGRSEANFNAGVLLQAYEHAVANGRDSKLARDTLLQLPSEIWQQTAARSKTDTAFEFFAEHGGLVALSGLLHQRWEAKTPIDSPAINKAIDTIWKRALLKSKEGEVRFDRADIYLGDAGKGLSSTRLLKLDVSPELRDRLVPALRKWPQTWEKTGAPRMEDFIQMSALWDTRPLTDVVAGLVDDSGKIPQRLFEQLSYGKHPQLGDALMVAFQKKQWPTYRSAEMDYQRIAANAVGSSNAEFVALAAEILSGRLRPDGALPSGRSLGRQEVATLVEAAGHSQRAGALVDSILRSSKKFEPARPIGFLESPVDAQKAIALAEGWRQPANGPQPEVAPFVRALWISPPPPHTSDINYSPKLPAISSDALAALLRVDPASRDDVLTIARGLLGAADLRTRAGAGSLLINVGEASDVALIMQDLRDERRRPLVMYALARWSTEKFESPLLDVLQRSKDDATSLAVFEILNERGTERSLEILKKLAVGDSAVAKAASQTMDRIERRKSRRLLPGTDTPYFGALWDLRSKGLDAVDVIDVAAALVALQTDDVLLQSQTLAWLKRADFGPSGHPATAEATLKLIDSPNVATACFATVAYAKSAGPTAVPRLLELLKAGVPFRTEAAAEGLAEIDHASAIAPLVKLLSQRETRWLGRVALRRTSVRNLEAVIAALQPLIDEADFDQAMSIGLVLAEVGRTSDMALLDQLQKRHPSLSSFVAEMKAAQADRPKSK